MKGGFFTFSVRPLCSQCLRGDLGVETPQPRHREHEGYTEKGKKSAAQNEKARSNELHASNNLRSTALPLGLRG